jgi:hypothetical protein
VRLVLDTNIIVSGLISPKGPPGQLLARWDEDQAFMLVTAEPQFDEILRVASYPKIKSRVPVALFRDLVEEMRSLAVCVGPLPTLTVSPDPDDNVLLAIAQVGQADLLVTGDKRDLLGLCSHGTARIVTARAALEAVGMLGT